MSINDILDTCHTYNGTEISAVSVGHGTANNSILLPTFIIEGNAKFQLEVNENEMRLPPTSFPLSPRGLLGTPELRRQAKLLYAVSSQESGYPW